MPEAMEAMRTRVVFMLDIVDAGLSVSGIAVTDWMTQSEDWTA